MIRFRWKRLLIPAVLAGMMFVAPDDTLGQRGGFGGGPGSGGYPGGSGGGPGSGGPGSGGPGGGRGGFNMGAMADSSFDRLVRSYGGSGETLDYSKIPPDVREQSNMMAQRFGAPPLPTSGTISKSDYRAQTEQRLAARMGGGAAPGAAPGPAPTTTGGGDKVVVLGSGGPADGKSMTMTMTPGGGMGGPGGGMGGPGSSGWGGGRGGDQMNPESRFKQMDRNQDGKISREESGESRRLREVFDQYDANRDGNIDLAEYSTYFTAAMGGSTGGAPGSSGWGGGGGGWGSRDEKKLEEQDEPKPVVYRFGHLPQGLPAYFLDADSDKDGQVGLYEWVKYWDASEVKLGEFKVLDQNGDGLLTAEEYIRVKKINVADLGKGAPGRGGAPAWGAPPADATAPVSPGAALEDQTKKDERSRDSNKDPRKEEKKEEKKDSRSGGESRGPSAFGQRPSGDTRSTTPGASGPGSTPGGSRFPGGGENKFNPGGPSSSGRPGGGR